jgi:hypothetical protein
MENKKWIFLCIIGGILMIISSVIGSISFFELVFSEISTEVGEDAANILSIILQILAYIAMGGGISVIIGALIVAMNHYRLGKFIIGLGAGMGLISLIIFLITSIVNGSIVEEFIGIVSEIGHGSYGFLGIFLTIVARFKLKKD